MYQKLIKPFVLACAIGMSVGAPLALADNDENGWEDELDAAHRALEQAAEQIANLTRGMSERVLGSFDIETGQRAILGVNIGPGRDGSSEGVSILGVSPGGPADRAGLKPGDLLLKIDDLPLTGARETAPQRRLQEYLGGLEPGTEVTLAFRRGKTKEEVTVNTVMQQMVPPLYIGFGRNEHHRAPHDIAIAVPPMHIDALRHWGDMELVQLTPGLGEYFGTKEGILVVRAQTNNPFGLRDGDVIQKIGGRSPQDPRHAMRILHSYTGGEKIDMTILRDKKAMELSADVPDRHDTYAVPVPPHDFTTRIEHET